MKNHTLGTDEYILLHDGRVQLCAHHFEYTNVTMFEYFGFLDTVNNIGCSLSLVGLAGIFGIHCAFPQLRQFPGRALMSHCLAMFWAQLIPLLGVKIQLSGKLCAFLALSSHFFWLCAFNWMIIMAVNMSYALVWQPYQRSEDREDTLLYRYLFPSIGWGLPSVIIILCTALHISGTFGFEYGNGSPCWISGYEANLIAFGVPVGLSLATNILCYIACVITVCRVRRNRVRDVIISMKVP